MTQEPSPQVADLVPRPDKSEVAVEPPGNEPGNWAGAPSAVIAGGQVYLAYRLRRPISQGRGYGRGRRFSSMRICTLGV